MCRPRRPASCRSQGRCPRAGRPSRSARRTATPWRSSTWAHSSSARAIRWWKERRLPPSARAVSRRGTSPTCTSVSVTPTTSKVTSILSRCFRPDRRPMPSHHQPAARQARRNLPRSRRRLPSRRSPIPSHRHNLPCRRPPSQPSPPSLPNRLSRLSPLPRRLTLTRRTLPLRRLRLIEQLLRRPPWRLARNRWHRPLPSPRPESHPSHPWDSPRQARCPPRDE